MTGVGLVLLARSDSYLPRVHTARAPLGSVSICSPPSGSSLAPCRTWQYPINRGTVGMMSFQFVTRQLSWTAALNAVANASLPTRGAPYVYTVTRCGRPLVALRAAGNLLNSGARNHRFAHAQCRQGQSHQWWLVRSACRTWCRLHLADYT
jgi:hypothetical protein